MNSRQRFTFHIILGTLLALACIPARLLVR